MPSVPKERRAYDHRLRQQVSETGDLGPVHARLRIPRSTIASWKRRGLRPVVSLDAFGQDRQQLLNRLDKVERKARTLAAVVRLLLALLRVSGFRVDGERLPEGVAKATVLRAITSAKPALPVAMILRIVGLPAARYHRWRNAAEVCGLDDRSSCPRSTPSQLTANEIASIKDIVLDPRLRHMPLRTLSLYSQRVGRVFASVTTWARLVRERGWRRLRNRVHPAKPTEGVRATKPNELWHIDVTILKLLDGTKAYLHAVIDNYSRKVLAWRVASRLDPGTTCNVLVDASRHLDSPSSPPTVVADSGIENVNKAVDAILESAKLRRVLALVEVTYSNSIIEAWWRSLKHQWLYLNTLDTMAHLERLVAFFVDAHNAQMPHSAFRGQTPNEMYFGTAATLPDELAAARRSAREMRFAANRAASCGRFPAPEARLVVRPNPS
jgi:putative transposase